MLHPTHVQIGKLSPSVCLDIVAFYFLGIFVATTHVDVAKISTTSCTRGMHNPSKQKRALSPACVDSVDERDHGILKGMCIASSHVYMPINLHHAPAIIANALICYYMLLQLSLSTKRLVDNQAHLVSKCLQKEDWFMANNRLTARDCFIVEEFADLLHLCHLHVR